MKVNAQTREKVLDAIKFHLERGTTGEVRTPEMIFAQASYKYLNDPRFNYRVCSLALDVFAAIEEQ